MANGLPPLEKLKKKELPPLNSLKKKGDGTPQPETTSQPTGVITQPLAQGSQQGTQPPAFEVEYGTSGFSQGLGGLSVGQQRLSQEKLAPIQEKETKELEARQKENDIKLQVNNIVDKNKNQFDQEINAKKAEYELKVKEIQSLQNKDSQQFEAFNKQIEDISSGFDLYQNQQAELYKNDIERRKQDVELRIEQINSREYKNQNEVDLANKTIESIVKDFENYQNTRYSEFEQNINNRYAEIQTATQEINNQQIQIQQNFETTNNRLQQLTNEFNDWQNQRAQQLNEKVNTEIGDFYSKQIKPQEKETRISQSLSAIKSMRKEQIDNQIKDYGIPIIPETTQVPKKSRIVTKDVVVPDQSVIVEKYIKENQSYLPKSESENLQEVAIGVGINKFNEYMKSLSEEEKSKLSVAEIEMLKSRYVDNEARAIQGDIKQMLLAQIPKEKQTTENLKRIEQDLWDNYRFGIDLSGDNEWNEKNSIQDGAVSFFVGASQLGGQILYLGATLNPFLNITGVSDDIKGWVESVNEKSKNILQEYTSQSGSMLESLKTGNYLTFAKQSLSTLASSAPAMILSGATGNPYLGYAALSLTSGTQTYLDVKDEEFFKELSDAGKVGYVGSIGAIEGLSELVGAKILGGMVDDMIKGLATPKTKKEFLNWFIGTAKANGINITADAATEMLPSVTQYLADSLAKGEKITFDGIKENALEGFLGGFGMVGVTSTVTTGLPAAAYFANVVKQDKLNKKIIKLNKEYSNSESKEERKIIAEQIINTRLELNKSLLNADKLYKRFSLVDKTSYSYRMAQLDQAIAVSEKLQQGTTAYEIQKEKIDNLYKEITAIEEKYAQQEEQKTPVVEKMSSKMGEILDTEKTPVVTEEEEKAPEVFEEEIVIPEEEIEKLNYDIARVEDEGTFGDNINQKAYRGSEEGMIKIDPQNENTIIFETNDKIYELGNKDEIGSELLSSQDITLTPPEGVNVVPKTNKTDVVSIDGKEYTVIGRRRDKKGKAVVRVKEVDTGLERRFVGEKAERILKDYNLRQGGKKVDIPDVKKQTEKPVVKTETKEEKRARKVEEKRKLEEMNQQEFDDAVAKSEKEVAEFEKAALDEAVKKAEKNKNKDLVQVNGNVYQVTKKDDGTFSVTKMREDGKLVRITDKAETSKAVAQFKREKTNQEKAALKEAEKMIKDVKKEEQDKILNLLDKLIDSTSSRGRVYDATLALPMFVANSSLKIVRASYKAGKSIAEAIKDGYNYVKSKGYGITEQEYKKYVAQNINKQQQSDTQDKTGIPSKEQKGQEPKQAKPKQEASGKKAETGRDVQTPKEKGRVTPDKTKEEVRVEPDEKEVKEVAEKAGITPKNLKDLYKINRDMFGLNKVKAFAQAVVMDRMIGAMAKRAGISKKEMYGKIEFRKASEKDIPQGVKFQVDAWHGSPYLFDKFELSKIGTGEGAQAFGWGLYFTDLESIARGYANNLSKAERYLVGNGIKVNNPIIYSIIEDIYASQNGGRNFSIKDAKDILQGIEKYDGTRGFFLGDNLTEKQLNGAKLFLDNYINGGSVSVNEVVKNAPVLYKVSLHKGKTPDQYTWLEWDKPVSEKIKNLIINQANKENVEKKNVQRFFGKGRQVTDTILLKDYLEKSGNNIYAALFEIIGSPKEASLFLLRAGIDGIKYPAESVSRGATSDTARGFNYVVFDENAISIEEVIKFQKDAEKARGAMMMAMDGKAIIYALTDPNVSTPLHELAHVFEHYLTEAERTSVLKWAGATEWTTEVSEKFARGFEKYLADGKAPTVSLQKIFNRFKEWLTDIYNGIVGSDIDIQLNDEMRDLYGKMLGVDAVKEQEKKSFANIIRGLKIDTTGKAFDATLGLPVAIYNNAIEITAKAVEAGVEVKKAIQKGIDYANKKMNGKKWDVEGFRNQLLTTIKGQFEQQAAQMRSSKKEVKTPKTRFLGFLTRSGAKIVNANDYIDSMKTNMNLDVSDTKKRIDDAKSKARKVFAKTNKIKNDKEVANIVNDLLNRIISPDEYNMTAQEAIDKIRKDIKNPKVAQELIDAGLDIRTQIDNMTKFMLENAEKFNLSDEAIENLKSNIGNYIHREYMFFSERGKTFRKQSLKTRRLEKWNPTDEMINEAIAEHAIYNGISVDEAKKQIEDLIEDWKKKRTPIKVTGNNVIRIQDVKVEADLMKGRVRIPQNFTLFSEASKEAEKELQKKGIDSENKNYNTLLSVETERIYKDKGGEYVELPPHLRKLLGEERNATQRYINTMLAMSNMVYKAQAMDMIVKSFDGKDGWIYDKEPANNKGDYKLVNDKYSPLNGKWVNIYLIEEFNKLPIYETDLAIAKAYFEYQSLVRTTKTAANPSTNFKNVIGGFFAQMQNGLFIALTNPKLAALSIYSRGHLYLKGRRNELAKQVLKDGAEAGVLSSSVDVEVLGLKGSILSERVKFGKSELGRRYAQQDDWTKSLMVYLYKQDVSLMLFGKKFDDLSKDQQKEVLTKTGELVKLGVPTFSKLPSWFRTISRLPTGDFISFTVEATRSLIGSGIIAYEHARAASTGVDSKGNTINETQRRAYAKDAAKRIAGLVAIQSVGKAIGAGAFSLGGSAIEYGSQVFAAIFGGGDDEDENDETKLAKTQVVKEINKTIPDWAVGDRVIVTNVDDDGNVTFYNWTGLEPSSETAQLIGGNFKYFEQFYKGSITAKMLIQLYNNENEIGNEIYLEDEPLYKQVFNSAYFLGKNTLLPPFINSTEYEIKRRKEDDENFGVISQDNTVEENAQSAKELTQVFLSRATIRSYNYNIYNRVKQIAYAQSRHGRVDNLDNIKDEEQIDLRLKNISVIRDAYQICLKHRITTSDSPAKIKKISELNDAVKRNYTDFEEAMIYETDDAKFKEMYDFVMSKSKDIVEYNKLKDERKK